MYSILLIYLDEIVSYRVVFWFIIMGYHYFSKIPPYLLLL